jgi:hypothetical protein
MMTDKARKNLEVDRVDIPMSSYGLWEGKTLNVTFEQDGDHWSANMKTFIRVETCEADAEEADDPEGVTADETDSDDEMEGGD